MKLNNYANNLTRCVVIHFINVLADDHGRDRRQSRHAVGQANQEKDAMRLGSARGRT